MADNTEKELAVESAPVARLSGKRPCLIMMRGDFIGQVFELNQTVVRLGRSANADLVLADEGVSRTHAMIVARDGGYYLCDLNSTNGTLLNRRHFDASIRLEEGDKIGIGEVVLRFCHLDEDDTQYQQNLLNMAVKDGLTRIYNARYFNEVLAKEFEYNRRHHTGLVLVMLDIDHFKQINDLYGHPGGDAVLRQMAELIEQEARGYDLFARVGGEEFALILRCDALSAGIVLAERVRSLIEHHTFVYEDDEISVTVSLGVSFTVGDDRFNSADELIRDADKRLYRAKDMGRNRVCH